MLSPATRLLVNDFLVELTKWRLNEDSPAHVVDRRVQIAEMVLSEVEPDDLLGLALRGLASAAIDACVLPNDVPTLHRYVNARLSYLQVLMAGLK